ncbi:GntR family transcriptional regulator [Pseudoxanthobacter sp.]|uniref:GntR family transcriptional regulator n=1 Tax=Pseudoxanthobacter sp. TaxID=1925742 RepID=UPI002FE2B206
MKSPDLHQKSLATRVFEIVRNAIVVGELVPGSLHSVQEIAEKLKVSRTPVREALLKLEELGMVSFERNRGARILETTVHDLEEIFSLRIMLEIPAAHRAAMRVTAADLRRLRPLLDEVRDAYKSTSANARAHLEPDARFHRQIALISGSRRLAGILDNLFDQQMIAGGTSGGFTREMEAIYRDHERIYDAIAGHDPAAAAAAMRDHLVTSAQALVAKETGDAGAGPAFGPLYVDVLSLNAGS